MRNGKKETKTDQTVMAIGKIALEQPKEKLYLALFRGILIFFAVYGSVGTYLSGFMVSYDEKMFVMILGIVSFYMGLIYYNKWTENIGYIVLLAAFAVLAFWMKAYIESGFAAIMNETTEVLSNIYDLPAIRMFQERLEERYTAITVCVIFIGVFVGILFHIIMTRYMNFFGTLAMMMPSVGIVFFFNRNVEKKYMLMLSLVLVIVVVLKREENYKSKKRLFSQIRKKKPKKIRLHIAKGSVFLQMGIVLLAVMGIFFGVMQMVYPKEKFKTPSEWQGLREGSDDTIRTILMVGFPTFITGQYGRGGISGGNLSGAVSVTPDYMTDLIVTFVPYTRETMYLRAFTGVNYEGKKWTDTIKGSYPFYDIPTENIHNKESNLLKKAYQNHADSRLIQTKMEIKNVDANEAYGYFPYYSIKEDKEQYCMDARERIYGSFEKGSSYTVEYYPYPERMETTEGNTQLELGQDTEETQLESRYVAYAEENYMQIPNRNKEILSEICDSIGREGTEQEKINRVENYLETECSYSKKPGAVPRGEDFVNYFLKKKKRGFCMHFASAGTLLLREMGIPARYVEGYAVPYTDVLNGESLDEKKYEDWFSGENPLGKTAVMEVEVDDSLAHAWVEVYQKGFGWRVADVTPAYYGEADDEGFWDEFRDAFRLEENTAENNPLQVQEMADGIKKVIAVIGICLALVFGGRIFCCIIWKRLIQKITYRRLYKNKQYNRCITYEYENFCQYLARVLKQEELADKEPKELFLELDKEHEVKTDLEKIIDLVEKALYSGHMLQEAEYVWCKAEMQNIMKELR